MPDHHTHACDDDATLDDDATGDGADAGPTTAESAYAAARAQVERPARLAALRDTGLLDSEVEEVFDRLTRLAVRLVGVPAAFLSLVDADRDFYKSACGFGEPLASARELEGPTFCHYAIQSREPLVIPDTAADPVYREVPTVRTLGVAAYVGIPLTARGQVIGSFCAIDVQPHAWTTDELAILGELATSAQRELDLRAALRESMMSAVELEAARDQLREQAQALMEANGRLERLNVRLDEANRAKSEFLASMSHELRTPLNAIGGHAELMLLGVLGAVTDRQRESLERLQRSQRHLLGLITAILDYARLEAGRVAYRMRVVRVADAVSAACGLMEPLVRNRGLVLGLPHRHAEDRTAVHADQDRLVQVLLNLLSNATRFTEAGGRITIDWAASGGGDVTIRVTDTGHGIPADKLQSIFEPFVQVDASHTRPSEGLGLGLAISRDLARGMGGDLTVESAVGVGTTFSVRLRGAPEAADGSTG